MTRNIYLRKDGRYEARVPLGKDENGKRHYRSFFKNTAEEAEIKRFASREHNAHHIPESRNDVFFRLQPVIRLA